MKGGAISALTLGQLCGACNTGFQLKLKNVESASKQSNKYTDQNVALKHVREDVNKCKFNFHYSSKRIGVVLGGQINDQKYSQYAR